MRLWYDTSPVLGGGSAAKEIRLLFAKARWIGRVLEGAGIDNYSKTGMELSTTLIKFSKFCHQMNQRGEGLLGMRLNLDPAEWALLGSILAPEEPRVVEHLSTSLRISQAEAMALVTRTSVAAMKVAEEDKPSLLPILRGEHQ